jgi:large subunit ribosomal protein L18e
MKKGPERQDIIEAITALRRAPKAKLFRHVADRLSVPRRGRTEVNISKISRCSKKGGVVVIPGKVLNTGLISQPVDVVALSFSEGARKKIEAAGGHCRDFSWFVKNGVKDVVLIE